jgi:UBA-like protein
MSATDSDAAIAQFQAITSADANVARFFLESSGGNIEAAISAFFEGGSSGGGQVRVITHRYTLRSASSLAGWRQDEADVQSYESITLYK